MFCGGSRASCFRRSPPVENSPHDLNDEGLPALSRTFHEPPAEPSLVPDEHCDERQDGKDHAELCELVEHRCLRHIRLRGKCRQTGTERNLLHIYMNECRPPPGEANGTGSRSSQIAQCPFP